MHALVIYNHSPWILNLRYGFLDEIADKGFASADLAKRLSASPGRAQVIMSHLKVAFLISMH